MHLPIVGLLYVAILNLMGFVLGRVYKGRARKKSWRTSENELLLVGVCGGIFGLLLGMGGFANQSRNHKLWKLLPFSAIVWGIVFMHLLSAVTLDRTIQYKEIAYSSPKISTELNGYVVAFITDTHSISAGELREVARRVSEYSPDLLLLGGDFPSQGQAPARTMEILSQIPTVDGICGVEGNHDHYMALFAAMEQYGITPLSNSGHTVRQGLYVAGVEDLWNRHPDIAMAAGGAAEDEFVLLLAHNADIAMQQDTTAADLILSGHTHGGQVTFFGLFAPALTWTRDISDYGGRFQSGWAKSHDGTDVYVSNGTGYLTSVPRVFARPQVILITLLSPAVPAD